MPNPVFAAVVFTAAPDLASSPQGAFVSVDGRASLLRAVELFVNREGVAQILVSVGPNDSETFKTKYASHLMILGIKVATATGATLKDHLLAALTRLAPEVTHVIVHDGARPAVAPPELDALLELAHKHDAIAMVTPLNAPVLEIEAGIISSMKPHKSLRSLVTPMVFTKKALEEFAHKGVDSLLSRITPFESTALNVRVNAGNESGMLKSLIALLPKPKMKGPSNPFEEASW
jgi:2-C-methyl-D-erythritol 4-phosphate cytidylyltransferase